MHIFADESKQQLKVKKVMRHLVIVALCSMLFFPSCVSKKVAQQVEGQRDSLAQVVSAKDSLINAVFEDINAISDNLSLIKARENIISAAAAGETGRRPLEEIKGDIAAIDRLLQDNQAKIASLQHSAAQLRKANVRIAGLEKTIADLNSRLSEKNGEVAKLRADLTQKGVEVAGLTEQVATQTAKAETLSVEKTQLQGQLNSVYYIVGAENELRDAQIVDKQGFIGRTLVVNKNGSLESFTAADARLLSEVAVGHKKVTVVSTHPEDSYQLVTNADKVVVKLVITDQVRFWEASKILVVSYR